MSLSTQPRKVQVGIAALIATAFFVLLSLAIIASPGMDEQPTGGAEDFDTLADAIFTDNVIALEALGVLLTAALIGAMVIARPLGSVPDSINYRTKLDAAGIAELQKVSDVEGNLGDGKFPTPTYTDINAGGEEE